MPIRVVCAWVTLTMAAVGGARGSRNELFPAPGAVFISEIARDGRGLLWLATKQGVFRFDGAHYQQIPGYPFAVARFIAVGTGGSVWAAGPQGLALYEKGEWKIVLRDSVEAMTLSSAGLWVNAAGLKLVGRPGSRRDFPGIQATGELVADADGSVWFPCSQGVCTLRPPDWRLEARPMPVAGDWQKIVPLQNGRRLWLSSADSLALTENGRVMDRQEAALSYGGPVLPWSLDPYQARDGGVFGTRLNLLQTQNLNVWPVSPIVENCSFLVGDQTRWFCAGERIGRSVRGENWETWTGGYLSAAEPDGLFPQGTRPPLAMTDRGIAEVDARKGEWERAEHSTPNAVLAMTEDGYGGYWLATRDEGLLRTDGQFAVKERFPKLCASIDTMRGLLRDGKGRTWVGGKLTNCFFEINGAPGHWSFQPQALPGATYQTVELHADGEGRPWVGYENGLAYLDDSGVWRRAETSEPVGLVRSFAFDGDSVIWLSRRRPGYFSRLTRHGDTWQVENFAVDKYGPADSWYMRRDSRGWVWRGTASGVQVARPGHYEPHEWLQLTPQKGLAADGKTLQGWAEDAAGDIWLAGSTGITRLRPSAEWFAAPPRDARPMVTRVRAGNETWLLDVNSLANEFSVATPGGVSVELSSMDANPLQVATLQYRVLPGDSKWHESADGLVRLEGLRAGSYQLEASYTGEGPAAVMRWNFQLTNEGGWWRGGLLLSGLSLLFGLTWWRWQSLQYWFTKPLFLLGRSMHRNAGEGSAALATVSWTNYSGHTFAKRYRIEKPLARGGFAVAYLADDLRSGAKVVVKVLHRSPQQEGWNRNRFAHEVAALHTVRHVGVVAILDSWISAEGEPCLAMEFVDGPTLRQLLDEQGSLAAERAARLIQQLGAALAAIHAPGIVHRDLKPENIIVRGAGTAVEQVVIIDFGTSAARGPERDLERTFTLTGTLHYLAPERLGNQYSAASDVYAFGVVVLEMLTGKRPADFAAAPVDPKFAMLLADELGETLAGEIASALHPDPAQRPVDAEAWAGRCSAEVMRRKAG